MQTTNLYESNKLYYNERNFSMYLPTLGQLGKDIEHSPKLFWYYLKFLLIEPQIVKPT